MDKNSGSAVMETRPPSCVRVVQVKPVCGVGNKYGQLQVIMSFAWHTSSWPPAVQQNWWIKANGNSVTEWNSNLPGVEAFQTGLASCLSVLWCLELQTRWNSWKTGPHMEMCVSQRQQWQSDIEVPFRSCSWGCHCVTWEHPSLCGSRWSGHMVLCAGSFWTISRTILTCHHMTSMCLVPSRRC